MDIKEYINEHQKNKERSMHFTSYLYKLMDERKIDRASELYIKVGISKQAYSKIISSQVNPSLNTCIKIALVLHLSNSECKLLLKKAGYTLSSSSTLSLIVRYCIENKIYSINALNDYLKEYGLEEI